MTRADRTTTEARHELRIIRGEVRPYLAYCPCGGFVLETGFPNFISWSYRKHINDPSVPTWSASVRFRSRSRSGSSPRSKRGSGSTPEDVTEAYLGDRDGRPVDGMTLQTINPERFRALPNPEQERLLAEIKERFGLAPEDVTEAYLDDRGSVRGVARIAKDENGQIVVDYAAADLVLDYLGETPADA